MMESWTDDDERRFRSLTLSQMQRGCYGLTLLALTLFPAFAFLDYYTQTSNYQVLWKIRFVTTFIYLLIYIFLRSGFFLRYPYALSLFLLSLGSISITSMCYVLDGFNSPYYGGINLVVLAAVLVLPVDAKRMAILVALIIGIYTLGCLLQSGFTLNHPAGMINNYYFILSTGVIGVTAAGLTQRMRVESFDRFLQTEKAKLDIKRSRDLLQVDLQSEQGNVEVLVREITERKGELEKALRFAESAKNETQRALDLREEFISLASHELNTPLTSLKMQTQIAQRKMEGGAGVDLESVRKIIQTYDSQLQRLIRIVNDMLDISRIKTGKLELELTDVDVTKLVRDVVERTSDKVQTGPGAITLRAPGPVVGKLDHFRIEQVILNLLTNALKYGRGNPVTVSVEKRSNQAIISVADRGIGIPEESLSRIFKRFERAVLAKDFSGLGLGLYISQQIVQTHGGVIEVESVLGEGSTFTVSLPLS